MKYVLFCINLPLARNLLHRLCQKQISGVDDCVGDGDSQGEDQSKSDKMVAKDSLRCGDWPLDGGLPHHMDIQMFWRKIIYDVIDNFFWGIKTQFDHSYDKMVANEVCRLPFLGLPNCKGIKMCLGINVFWQHVAKSLAAATKYSESNMFSLKYEM